MSQSPGPAIRIHADPTNPGQFFACCGLLELADRLWTGAEGWFDEGGFLLHTSGAAPPPAISLSGLLSAIAGAPLRQIDPEDDCASPIEVPAPFGLRLDWWKDERAGGNRLKVWAGRMGSLRIARAMQHVLARPEMHDATLLDRAMVVYDPQEGDKKVEPFYFDARRGASAQAIDIGFAPDPLSLKSAAYPAVEFLCLAGLQRHRPVSEDRPRVFTYHTWDLPLPATVAPSAVCGLLPHVGGCSYRFENSFRTDQRKHKAFTPATPMARSRQ